MSIKPGTSQKVELDPAVNAGTDNTDEISSVTMNPLSPVEYGRTVAGGVQSKATAATSLN